MAPLVCGLSSVPDTGHEALMPGVKPQYLTADQLVAHATDSSGVLAATDGRSLSLVRWIRCAAWRPRQQHYFRLGQAVPLLPWQP